MKTNFLHYRYIMAFVAILMIALQLHAETKRALLIGISDYGNATEDTAKWKNIHGANDIALLTPLLKKQGYNITTLVDKQATHAGIIGALDRLAKSITRGDVVYIHFSMHGQPFEDHNDDEGDGWDEALIPVDAEMKYQKGIYEGENHLLDDELEVYVNRIRSKIGSKGHLYVVLDACHCGESSRGGDSIRGTSEGFSSSGKKYMPNRSKDRNDYFRVPTAAGQSPVVFIEACRSYQLNKEIYDVKAKTRYGSLSYYIAQAMKAHHAIGTEAWFEAIKSGMESNNKLRKQNLVIEASE